LGDDVSDGAFSLFIRLLCFHFSFSFILFYSRYINHGRVTSPFVNSAQFTAAEERAKRKEKKKEERKVEPPIARVMNTDIGRRDYRCARLLYYKGLLGGRRKKKAKGEEEKYAGKERNGDKGGDLTAEPPTGP